MNKFVVGGNKRHSGIPSAAEAYIDNREPTTLRRLPSVPVPHHRNQSQRMVLLPSSSSTTKKGIIKSV
ncbi:hypothetical protein E2C01_090152 [Portunus trituberculatus]|uniref:Uncharacterized protein n=1 Tax=Portunus trituberculatus TaxID=210409 RepID=A0A5B7JDX7_PORTR|nr:hypothetical protein [Portunus trituberculatus]